MRGWLIGCLALVLLITGCSKLSYSRFLSEELGLRGNPLRDPGVINYLETLPLAQLMLVPQGRGGTLFVLADRRGEVEVWVDSAGARLYRRDGHFEGSEGVSALPLRVENWDLNGGRFIWPGLGEASPTKRFVRWVELPDESFSEQQIELFDEGPEILSILSAQVPTRRWREEVMDEYGRRWKNHHWVLDVPGYVVRSRMRTHAETSWVTIETMKMPRKPE